MSTSRSNLIRLASTFPIGSKERETYLAQIVPKVASSNDIIEYVLPEQELMKLVDVLEKAGDTQSSALVMEVYQKLAERLEITTNEASALNRLKNTIQAADSWRPDLLRNNVFKAADLLGIKLPSGMF